MKAPRPTIENAAAARLDGYARTLGAYCQTRDEAALDAAEELALAFVIGDAEPDAIVEAHMESLSAALAAVPARQRPHAALASQQFLLEVVLAYGAQLRGHLEAKAGRRLQRAQKGAARDRERADASVRQGVEQSEALLTVAHELAGPIMALGGNLELADRALARGETARARPRLGRSREALHRLTGMVHDLQRAARGEALELEVGPVDLASLVAQGCEWAQAAAVEKGVVLTKEPAPSEECVVQGDADALVSVFGNLVSNAIRYTPAGGRVTVSQRIEQDKVVTEIRDTGIGMTPEVRGHIFERLYRAPEAREMAAEGLGVGLALVRRLVLAHAGSIEVESSPGEGSTFRFLLPLASSASGHRAA